MLQPSAFLRLVEPALPPQAARNRSRYPSSLVRLGLGVQRLGGRVVPAGARRRRASARLWRAQTRRSGSARTSVGTARRRRGGGREVGLAFVSHGPDHGAIANARSIASSALHSRRFTNEARVLLVEAGEELEAVSRCFSLSSVAFSIRASSARRSRAVASGGDVTGLARLLPDQRNIWAAAKYGKADPNPMSFAGG